MSPGGNINQTFSVHECHKNPQVTILLRIYITLVFPIIRGITVIKGKSGDEQEKYLTDLRNY